MTLLAAVVDAEKAVHDWINAHPDLHGPDKPLPAGAQFAPLRSPWKATFVVVSSLGGTPNSGDAPYAWPRLSLDVWAPAKVAAAAAAAALANAIFALAGGSTLMGALAVCHGAALESLPVWVPDPAQNIAHYTVTASFMLRAA